MIYKLQNGGIIKLQKGKIIPKLLQKIRTSRFDKATNRAFKSSVPDAVQRNIEAGKIGWVPRQTSKLWHNSNDNLAMLEVTFPAWDVVERGAPLGHSWLSGSETTSGFLAKRPYRLIAKEVTISKPLIQIGEAIGDGKNVTRNQILDFAQKSSADGMRFSGIADNQLQNQNIYALFKNVPITGRIAIGSRPISEAEKLGIPKGERSNPKALEDPQYWGYQQWNSRYNAALSAGNIPEMQRLRALHFITKAPNTKIIDETGMPKEVYHGSLGEKFTVFDSSKTRPDYDYGTSTNMFSDNKNVALGYANNDSDKLYSVYLNLRNILERDFKGNPWNGSVNNSGKFQIVPEYEATYSSKQEAETALQKMLDQYYPNNPAKQAEQRHYMYIIELMDPPHPERSTNAFSDEIANIPTLDGGIVRNVKDYYDLPRFDENPELYKELTSPHTDYFVKDPRNIKSSAIITYDNFGRIIPIVKRDNFHNPDIRFKKGGKIK